MFFFSGRKYLYIWRKFERLVVQNLLINWWDMMISFFLLNSATVSSTRLLIYTCSCGKYHDLRCPSQAWRFSILDLSDCYSYIWYAPYRRARSRLWLGFWKGIWFTVFKYRYKLACAVVQLQTFHNAIISWSVNCKILRFQLILVILLVWFNWNFGISKRFHFVLDTLGCDVFFFWFYFHCCICLSCCLWSLVICQC